jgi:hypothetical protein
MRLAKVYKLNGGETMVERKRKRREKHQKSNRLKQGIYKEDTCGNKNIPTGAVVYGTLIGGNEEILFTFYKNDGKLWKVDNWKGNAPKPTNAEEIRKLINYDIDGVVAVAEPTTETVVVKKVKETVYVRPEDDYTKGKYLLITED